MNKYLLLASFLFCFSWAFAQKDKVIEGRLIGEEGEAVPYATILSIDPTIYGGVSNTSGKFKIPVYSADSILRFFISSLGYKDTIVIMAVGNSPNEIELFSEAILMEELQIDAKKLTKFSLGSRNYSFPAMSDSSLMKMSIYGNNSTEGSSVGNMYKIVGKDKIMESASFYIDNPTEKERMYLVNFYESFGKYKYFFLNNRVELTQKNDTNILFTVGESGWYEVQLLDYGITLKKKSNFFVSITDVTSTKNLNSFDAETLDLVMQMNNNSKTYQFITTGNKFSILKSKDRKFAIVLNLLTE